MKIKRILSATLAAAMLLCCCILTAFAENETYIGYYNGYSYTCSATCYVYKNTFNEDKTGIIRVTGKGFIETENLKNVKEFYSMKATFKVGSHVLETIFVSA